MSRTSRDFIEALADVPEQQRTWVRLNLCCIAPAACRPLQPHAGRHSSLYEIDSFRKLLRHAQATLTPQPGLESAVYAQKRLLVTPASKDKSSAHKNSGKDDGQDHDTGKHETRELVDLRDLNRQQRQQIVDNALATNEQSNEVLLERYADRAERWGICPHASS